MNLTTNTHNCAVCLEELTIPSTNICITDCSHAFHLNCLLKNRQHNTRCPVCRKDIPSGDQPVLNQRITTTDNTRNYYLKIYLFVLVLFIIFQAYNNAYFERNDVPEEMAIENQLNHDIKGIMSAVAHIEIRQKEPVVDQILKTCVQFGNSALHYVNNILKIESNYLQPDMNHLHSKIVQIVNNAVHHNITFDQFENDIRNCCFAYTESLIFNV